jgi:hypothetical protein
MGDFLSTDDDGLLVFDLEKANALGSTDLIERLVINDFTGGDGSRRRRIDVKLYSAQRALIHLGKAQGLFKNSAPERAWNQIPLSAYPGNNYPNLIGLQRTYLNQLISALNRFVRETFGSDIASNAYWRGVVYGFIPNPLEHGLLPKLQPSTALDGHMKLEKYYSLCLEMATKELTDLNRDPQEIYNNALKYGFVEGPYPDQTPELPASIFDPARVEDQERFSGGIYRW